ncbi:putative membrane protein, partial [Chlamydia psittaci 84-8471/1]
MRRSPQFYTNRHREVGEITTFEISSLITIV